MNNNNNNNNSRPRGSGKQKKKNQNNLQKQPKQKASRRVRAKRGGQQQLQAAAAYATGQVSKAPAIKMSSDSCRVVHRELIASVTGTTAFTVAQSFALNPGISATFPWLSVMAQTWEQYRFRSLRFCYYTRTGSNVPGSVILAPDYDAADAAPVSEQVASNYTDAAEDAPWKDIECVLTRLDMAGGQKRHFTRTGALAANLDIKTYDVGQLHLCTIDGTAVAWGKLWVEYDVEFFVPQLPPNGGALVLGGLISGQTSMTAGNPLGTAPIVDTSAQGLSASAASVVTIAGTGQYLVYATCGGTTITGLALAATSGCTVNIIQNFLVNAAGTVANILWVVIVTQANATVTLSATAATVTATSFYVASAPPASLA